MIRVLVLLLCLVGSAEAQIHTTVYPVRSVERPFFGRCNGASCQVAPSPTVSIDYGRLINAMASDPRFRGPQGAPGPAGPASRLDYAALIELLASDSRFSREPLDYAFLLDVMAEDPRFRPAPPLPDIVPPGPVVLTPVPQPTQSPAAALDRESLLNELLERMAADPRFRGPRGEPGPAGLRGPPALINLPPVVLEIIRPDGSIARQSKPLGQPIRLKLVPIEGVNTAGN